jgi:hypothetical protein
MDPINRQRSDRRFRIPGSTLSLTDSGPTQPVSSVAAHSSLTAGPRRSRSRIGETATSSQASRSDPPTVADSEHVGVVYGPELERSDQRDVIWMSEASWDLGRMSLVTAVPASEVRA